MNWNSSLWPIREDPHRLSPHIVKWYCRYQQRVPVLLHYHHLVDLFEIENWLSFLIRLKSEKNENPCANLRCVPAMRMLTSRISFVVGDR